MTSQINFYHVETHSMGINRETNALVSYYADENADSPSDSTWFVPGLWNDVEPESDWD